MNVLRRLRAHAGTYVLTAALTMTAAMLLTAVPRVANGLSETGLRQSVRPLPWQARDLEYNSSPMPFGLSQSGTAFDSGELDVLQAAMPPVLRRLVAQRWYLAATESAPVHPAGPDRLRPPAPVELGFAVVTGSGEATRLVDGRWPESPAGVEEPVPEQPVEVAVSRATADLLGLRAGSRWSLRSTESTAAPRTVTVVGVFELTDPDATIWDPMPVALQPTPPVNDGDPYIGSALTTEANLAALTDAGWSTSHRYRYRIDPDRLELPQTAEVISAIRQVPQKLPPGMTMGTGLDGTLQRFADSLRSVRALLAVVWAGVIATLGGLIALATRLAIRRRRAEFALIRARGADPRQAAWRSLAESLLVVPPAALAGWGLGRLVPGSPAATGWLVVLATVVVMGAFPLTTAVSRPSVTPGRPDSANPRTTAGRRTVEIAVLVFATLGVFLLRRRGLPAGGLVDPLLVAVPVLFAAATALLVLRAYPWPLRLLVRAAGRARGAVAFLGLARAVRSALAGPLIVLVVATTIATFCGVVAAGIRDGRDRASQLTVPGDAVVTGGLFAADTAAVLAALPGVRGVSPFVSSVGQRLSRPDGGTGGEINGLFVLLLDGATYNRVVTGAESEVTLPPTLTGAQADGGPVPALASPAVAAAVTGTAIASVANQQYEVRVAAVRESFPLVPPSADRFLVLPWQALPASGRSITPTGFVVAGAAVDRAALWEVGDQGQRRWFASGVVAGTPPKTPISVISRTEHRASLETDGANGVLSFVFGVGVLGGIAFGLLAVAFTVLAETRARGRALSRLRTLGMSHRQWRGLFGYEHGPLLGVSVLTGVLVGTLLPLLLTPALGLSAFTSGVPVRVRFEPAVIGAGLAVVALSLAIAVAVEEMANRRLRLGETATPPVRRVWRRATTWRGRRMGKEG